ncbi:MAG: hypothetical protein JSV44_04490, partial [Candidatus Zixiibacteriota bacterium]
PGEDFLQNLPGGAPPLAFCDENNPGEAAGTIVITLEPDNFNADSTNFPLILMVGPIPSYEDVSDTLAHVQLFPLMNQFQAVPGNPYGWPALKISLTRY